MTKPRLSQRDPERTEFARAQRKQANEFSHDVWQMIRAGRMLGEKFRREYPLGPYTLDFVCVELKLNIEIDGKDHLTDEGKQHDSLRDAYLKRQGFSVLRIPGFRVTQDPASVRNEIESFCGQVAREEPLSQNTKPLSPDPSPRSGARGDNPMIETNQKQLGNLRWAIVAEQHRIAECLTSLDALITGETQKLEALKIHKRGLMQQLFPTCSLAPLAPLRGEGSGERGLIVAEDRQTP